MKCKKTIITSKQKIVNITSKNNDTCAHIENFTSYVDIIIRQINEDKLYQSFFSNKNDLVILDIGANIGLFSLYAHDCARKIYAFEPTPNHFNILRELTASYDNIVPVNMAISDKTEDIAFYLNNDNTTMNSIVNKYSNSIIVRGISIIDFITQNNIKHVDFVKCDIEGSEMKALTPETIEPLKYIIDFWFIEVHATENSSLENNAEILKRVFENAGYIVERHSYDGFIMRRCCA